MRLFEVDFQGLKNTVYCKSESTRSGFKHVARMYYNGNSYTATRHYYNRTYEYYDFQSVMQELFENIVNEFKEKAVNNWKVENNKQRISKDKRQEIYKKINVLFADSVNSLKKEPKYTYVEDF